VRPDNATLKRALRARFPAVRFSVTSGRGTAACWTHVAWTDGPTERLVEDALADLSASPGHMDQTDYFEGERVSLDRTVSDLALQHVAGVLLGRKPVPPRELWARDVLFSNGRGWRNFYSIVHGAAQNRENLDLWRFEAHAWLAAVQAGSAEAPTSVDYVDTLVQEATP
jgi:hypothetical protein